MAWIYRLSAQPHVSLFAIAFVVIFSGTEERWRPSAGFNVLASTFSVDDRLDTVHRLIESIVNACDSLSKSKTGALMIIERQTNWASCGIRKTPSPLMLRSQVLSYKSFIKALHDGAVLIRGGRVSAARVHVLSQIIIARREFGTRHQTAIGASEMGDYLGGSVGREPFQSQWTANYMSWRCGCLARSAHRLLSAKPEKRTGLGGLWTSRRQN